MHKLKYTKVSKPRVRNEQTRCRVACGEESFVLDFLFLFYQEKRKENSFVSSTYGEVLNKKSIHLFSFLKPVGLDPQFFRGFNVLDGILNE